MRLLTILVVLFAFEVTAFAEDKLPIPDDAGQKQAVSLIADLYKVEYEEARTPEQKTSLALKLINVGKNSNDDPTGRYVLFRLARDIAAIAGNAETALSAIDNTVSLYDVDELSLKADVLAKVIKELKYPVDHQNLAPTIQKVFDSAVSQDRFDIAKAVNAIALDSARQARSTDLLKQVLAQSQEVKEIESEFQKVQKAIDKLNTAPTDPEANYLAGRYQCFVKNDWDKGLLMLALGNDLTLKQLAEAELAEKANALSLGDSWWGRSEEYEGRSKQVIQSHASDWYRKALPTLAGLSKARAEERLGVQDVETPAETKTDATDVPKKINVAVQFPNEEAVKQLWSLSETGWRIENNGMLLHGKRGKWISTRFHFTGDFTFKANLRLGPFGEADIFVCGEKIELKGKPSAQNIGLTISRQDKTLHVIKNSSRSQIQIKDDNADQPTKIKVVYGHWDTRQSSLYIGAAGLQGTIIEESGPELPQVSP